MKELSNIVQKDMERVNEIIVSCIKSQEDLVEVVSKYLIDSGGKRIRPTLTILCSKLFGYDEESCIKLAAAVEFIHAATLLHDDVVDNSTMRRSQHSANIVWGNKTSILVGDFLFSQSFKLMVSAGSMICLRSLANAAAIISEGEVMQLVRNSEKRMLTELEYEEIVKAKTAELFGAACEVGAIIANQKESVSDILKVFGMKLGFIFQVRDDYLDYFGESIGKNIGADFSEGKITIPVIMAYSKATEDEKYFWNDALFNDDKNTQKFNKALEVMKRHDVVSAIEFYIDKLIKDGEECLAKISGDESCKEHLKSLLYYAASRKN